MLITDLIQSSPSTLITVRPDTNVREAAQLLSKNHIGLLLVLGDSDELTGVISERDIIGAMGSSDTNIDHVSVDELMTDSVITVSSQDSLVNAVTAMNQHGIRHLVVMEDDIPAGVISILDVLRAFAEDVMKNGGVTDNQANRAFISALAAYQIAGRLSIQV